MSVEALPDGLGDSEDEAPAPVAPEAAKKTPAKSSSLPSADTLLDTTTASAWLQKPTWAIKPRELAVRAERAVEAPVEVEARDDPDASDYGDDMYEFYDPAKGWQGKRNFNFVDDASGYGIGMRQQRQHGAEANEPKAKKREAADKPSAAKDRVKQQRLAGQSGIGEDFRVWRSEEEMRLRQHGDRCHLDFAQKEVNALILALALAHTERDDVPDCDVGSELCETRLLLAKALDDDAALSGLSILVAVSHDHVGVGMVRAVVDTSPAHELAEVAIEAQLRLPRKRQLTVVDGRWPAASGG
ncbi:hypothetical protein CTAYLR_004730 [Chrysophaeum taylorii]|uniref:Uncharacterized protein n=1 Tax=Chrysophaeum taylorii TaxID=2483200 RepID=A0AAD7U8A9_9STRA|nr:hypothetical protein CTAYLR_004730 [Chrysophaeum taylorii]